MGINQKLPNCLDANLKLFEDITNSIIKDYKPRNSKDLEKTTEKIKYFIKFLEANLIKEGSAFYDKDYNEKIEKDIEKLKNHSINIKK